MGQARRRYAVEKLVMRGRGRSLLIMRKWWLHAHPKKIESEEELMNFASTVININESNCEIFTKRQPDCTTPKECVREKLNELRYISLPQEIRLIERESRIVRLKDKHALWTNMVQCMWKIALKVARMGVKNVLNIWVAGAAQKQNTASFSKLFSPNIVHWTGY